MHTIQGMLEATVQASPERPALQFGTYRLTHRQLYDEVLAMTARLIKAGITPGHTVALVFENTPVCVIGFLALACMDATVVPLGTEVTGQDLAAIHANADFAALLGATPAIRRLTQAVESPPWAFLNLASGHVMSKVPAPRSEARAPEDTTFLVHYTSGSTGRPKGALHSQQNLINGGLIYRQTYQITHEDRVLCPIPLCHSFGMVVGLVTPLLCGAELVLLEGFTPQLVLRTLSAQRISMLLAVPLIYDMLARSLLSEPLDLSALRICLSSGAPLPPETVRRFRERYNVPIYQVYGTTETGVIAAQQPSASGRLEGSVGRPLEGIRVRVLDDTGLDAPPGEAGALLVQTPAMFAGYLKDQQATAGVLHDGWYLTGDVVRQDADGCLYLVGRKETFINVGGKKVNPIEVEDVLRQHPAVQEVMVYGGDANAGSQRVEATVVPQDGVDEQELIAWCRTRLPSYKVPQQIALADELPKTSMGKIRRTSERVNG